MAPHTWLITGSSRGFGRALTVAALEAGDKVVATAGDPSRAGEILVRVIKQTRLPSHLLLGAGAAQMAIDYSGDQIAEATVWQEVSASADFDAPYPAELPAMS